MKLMQILTNFLSTMTISLAFAQAPAPVPAILPMQNPKVMTPKSPTVSTPTVSSPAVKATASAGAPFVTQTYDENAYKAAVSTGAPVLLVFSGVGDSIWAQQAPTLQVILRESEFSRTPAFQIDMSNSELATKYNVTVAGTLLIMKGGYERLRSTRMTKADVIRKMLRLQTVL